MIGDKELQKKLAALPAKIEKRVIGGALAKSRTRVKRRILVVMVSPFFKEVTGAMAASFKKAKATSRAPKGLIRRGLGMPPEAEDAIKLNAVEYGHEQRGGGFVKAKPVIRSTINAMQDEEYRQIGRDMGTGIEKLAKK